MKEEEEEEEETEQERKNDNRGGDIGGGGSDGNNNNVRNGKGKCIVKETQKGIAEKKIKAFEAVREGQEWR